MPKHADNEEVMVTYSSMRNIKFRSLRPEGIGFTWSEWREMSQQEQADALTEFANRVVDIEIVEDEN